jgi:HlyD family secretion protein
MIKDGQPVRDTEQAQPTAPFTGRVQQVRLQSTIAENVVNYTVVVEVENRENKLLPGMTASLDFLVQSADDVLKVSNAALRFTPPASMLAERPQSTGTAGGEGRTARRRGNSGGGEGRPARAEGQSSFGRLFYLDDAGALKVARVRTGISDRSMTEIQGGEIRPGMKVIAGVTTSGATDAEAANPFGNRQQGQQRRGPGSSF